MLDIAVLCVHVNDKAATGEGGRARGRRERGIYRHAQRNAHYYAAVGAARACWRARFESCPARESRSRALRGEFRAGRALEQDQTESLMDRVPHYAPLEESLSS